MSWLLQLFNSSVGKKVIMALTGLFLIMFLLAHMSGNLQLFANDGGEAFNKYAYFMTHNPLVKTISYGLYAMILLHTIKGLMITFYNRKARGPVGYNVSNTKASSWQSRNMAILGSIVFIFIAVHMAQFWGKMKFGEVPMVTYGDHEYKDLYNLVAVAFKELWIVIFYVVAMVVLAFHLLHGFQSGFQTLGMNHKKYTPIIKGLGVIFAIAIPLGFAAMPLYFYFMQ